MDRQGHFPILLTQLFLHLTHIFLKVRDYNTKQGDSRNPSSSFYVLRQEELNVKT